MERLVWFISLSSWLMLASCMETVNNTDAMDNSTDPNKDMYVIHAMVYQVGILTNSTDNETSNLNQTGHQEAVTFFHNNGSQVDLSQIPAPLLTNVTAQSMVGVAPVTNTQAGTSNQLPWSTLNQLTGMGSPANQKGSTKTVRDVQSQSDSPFESFYKRLFKRETGDSTVAIRKGSAVVPPAAGVQSIAIPPLLSLNNNFSEIPVPIPNTSVVHYAKVNTLVTKP